MTDPWLLVEAHRERLYRIARRRTGSNADAEDVVQEAMLRVATFEALDHERVGEILTSVTMRLCVDLARRRAVESSALPKLVQEEHDPLGDLLDAAEARFLASVPLTKVERTLLLARIHGLYPSEVAEALGLTRAAAKMALERARRKIVAAWKATLGVFGLSRLRRLLPVGGAAAVAMATLGILSLLPVPGVPLATSDSSAELPERRAPRTAVVVTSTSSPAPGVTVTPAYAVVPAASPTATPRPTELYVDSLDGPVWHEGIKIVVDPSEPPVDRLQRCLRNGVDVDPRNLSVTCRE